MKWKWDAFRVYAIGLLMVLIFVSGRYWVGGNDFSYFFVAGTDFVNAAETPIPIIVQPGQGYDGQFFYRYAHNPLDFSQTNYGVTVDFVSYRIQRFGYPALAWVFSLGGRPQLVPFALVLVNILAFLGILTFFQRFVQFAHSPVQNLLIPLFLFGIYMSVAKDLAEVTELFFFIGALWFYFNKSFIKFSLCAIGALLCRETSLVAFVPLLGYELFGMVRAKKMEMKVIWMILPISLFTFWKVIIVNNTPSGTALAGAGNIGWPFLGVIQGFIGNLDISTTKNLLQLAFWMLYFIWQLWLIRLVLTVLYSHRNKPSLLRAPLAWIYISWLIFSVVLSAAIYVDDWSFVRVFSLWNLTGMIILITSRQVVSNTFQMYSWFLLILTLGRLIIRP